MASYFISFLTSKEVLGSCCDYCMNWKRVIVLIDHGEFAENVGNCIEVKVLRDILGRCGVLGLNSWPGLFET